MRFETDEDAVHLYEDVHLAGSIPRERQEPTRRLQCHTEDGRRSAAAEGDRQISVQETWFCAEGLCGAAEAESRERSLYGCGARFFLDWSCKNGFERCCEEGLQQTSCE